MTYEGKEDKPEEPQLQNGKKLVRAWLAIFAAVTAAFGLGVATGIGTLPEVPISLENVCDALSGEMTDEGCLIRKPTP